MRSFWIESSSSTSRMVGDPASSRWLDAGREPGTPYYSPRRGGLRLTRARRSASAPRCTAAGRKRRSGAARSTSRSTAGSCGRRRCSCSGRCSLLALTIGAPGPVSRLDAAAVVRRPVGRGARDRAGARLSHPRQPGSGGAAGAAQWVKDKLALYGLAAAEDALGRDDPRPRPRPSCRTSSRSCPARRTTRSSSSPTATTRASAPGANDNASGTAALIELARGYGTARHRRGPARTPQHTLIFLSSDGGAYGGFGAERFAVDLAATATGSRRSSRSTGSPARARPRLELAGLRAALARSGADPDGRRPGRRPARRGRRRGPAGSSSSSTSACRSATASRRRSSAARSRRSGSRPRRTTTRLPRQRHPGASRRDALSSGSAGPPSRSWRRSTAASSSPAARPGTSTSASRIIRGWAIELVLLVGARPVPRRGDRPVRAQPAAAAAAARRPGARSGRGSASGSGRAPASGSARSPACSRAARRSRRRPDSPAVTDWPVAGLARPRARSRALGWLRARRRARSRVAPAGDDDVLAGVRRRASSRPRRRRRRDGARSAPTACSSSLPSLYAWLWLPQLGAALGWARDVALRRRARRAGARARRRSATQLGLGLDAPLYLVSLMTLGFIPWTTVLVLIAWAAVACAARRARGRPLPGGAAARSPSGPPAPTPRAAGSRPASPRRARPSPRGTWTIASAAVVCTIMCDSWPAIGSSTGPVVAPARSARGRSRRARAAAHRARRALPGRNGGAGSGCALERAQRRASRRAARRRATRRGFPGSPNTSVAPRTPNASGLPGRIATPQKTSSTPRLGLDPARRGRAGRPRRRPR